MKARNTQIRSGPLVLLVSFCVALLVGAFARHAHAEATLTRTDDVSPVAVKLGKRSRDAYVITGEAPLVLKGRGPGTIAAKALRRLVGKWRKAGDAELAVTIGTEQAATQRIRPRPGKARLVDNKRAKLGRPVDLTLELPEGEHEVKLSVKSGDKHGVVVIFEADIQVAAAASSPLVEATPEAPTQDEPDPVSTKSGAAETTDEVQSSAKASSLSSSTSSPEAQNQPEPASQHDTAGQQQQGTASPDTEDAGSTGGTGDASSGQGAGATIEAEAGVDVGSERSDEADTSPSSVSLGAGLRAGAYHPSGGSDLGAAFALGAEIRLGLPVLPSSLGTLGVAMSGGWLSFFRQNKATDPELGEYKTRYDLTFVPVTLEGIYTLPTIAGLTVYGGGGLAVYAVRATSKGFGAKDKRLSIRPGFQVFGAVGLPLGPLLIAAELRYTNVTVNFDTGTVGNGSGMFGQAVATFRFF